MDSRFLGMRATMEVKMSRDMPLPMPLSVMSSPSHMIRPVPAVMVTIMRAMVRGEEWGTSGSGHRMPKGWSVEAVATIAEDWSTPRPMVR